jgi:hypothetical protein
MDVFIFRKEELRRFEMLSTIRLPLQIHSIIYEAGLSALKHLSEIKNQELVFISNNNCNNCNSLPRSNQLTVKFVISLEDTKNSEHKFLISLRFFKRESIVQR